MTVIYRTNGAWGAGKGSPLSAAEVDGNFWDLVSRVTNIETAPTENPITSIDVTNGQMTITVAGGEVFGPFTLPVFVFTPRGDWVHPEHYYFGDIITDPGTGGYMVMQEHDTETPFNPGRLIGGNPVYELMFPPGAQGPSGADGLDGAQGPPGPTGYFKIDVEAAFSLRDAYDNEDPGFVFISNDGADGLGGLPVMYIMGEGSAGNWTGPYTWGAPEGPQGPTGPAGPAGSNSDWDAQGLYVNRPTYDSQPPDFVYLSTDGDGGITTNSAVLFIRQTATAGVWSPAIPFQGPEGPDGPAGPAGPVGPAGPPGANADWDAQGTFAQRSSYNAQPKDFTYLSTNGDGATITSAVLFIKASNTNADWGPAIPFQGPKGNTGPPGPAGPGGPAGPIGPQGPAGASGAAGKSLKTVTSTPYTCVAGDEDTYLRFTFAGAVTVNVNTGIFAAGDELIMRATGGQLTLAGSATAGKPSDVQAKSRAAHSTIHAYFVDGSNYDLTGDLALV